MFFPWSKNNKTMLFKCSDADDDVNTKLNEIFQVHESRVALKLTTQIYLSNRDLNVKKRNTILCFFEFSTINQHKINVHLVK